MRRPPDADLIAAAPALIERLGQVRLEHYQANGRWPHAIARSALTLLCGEVLPGRGKDLAAYCDRRFQDYWYTGYRTRYIMRWLIAALSDPNAPMGHGSATRPDLVARRQTAPLRRPDDEAP